MTTSHNLHSRLLPWMMIASLAGCVAIPSEPLLMSNWHPAPTASEGQHCNDVRPQRNPASVLADSFEVLNWNVYKGNGDGWLADFESFSNHSDILILQEAFLDAPLQAVISDYFWDLNTGYTYRETAAGVMTASLIQPQQICSFRVKEPFIAIPKTVLVSRYPIANSTDTLLVANIHSINFTLGLNDYREQLDKLSRIMEHHHGPMIISGDFNTWSSYRMDLLQEYMQSLSLQAVHFDPLSRATVMGEVVDHMFYRGLEVEKTAAFPVQSSDHFPMKVTFKFAPQAR